MTLRFQNIAFERHYQFLFHKITGELHEGELLQIHGTNGSGKSTLLRILAGLLEPHQGDVSWNNQSIFRGNELYRQDIHYLGHLNGVKPYLTVLENLNLFSTLTQGQIRDLTLQTLRLDHLKNTRGTHLSAGQSRQLALARLLLRPASLWILDEPTTSLDHDAQQFFMKILRNHLDQGGRAIVATHQPIRMLGKIIELEK